MILVSVRKSVVNFYFPKSRLSKTNRTKNTLIFHLNIFYCLFYIKLEQRKFEIRKVANLLVKFHFVFPNSLSEKSILRFCSISFLNQSLLFQQSLVCYYLIPNFNYYNFMSSMIILNKL